MNSVVTPAVNRTKIGGIIRATFSLLDQMVRGVGAGLAADMADAPVAGDHPCRQLPPGLCAVGTIHLIAAHALRWTPAVWPVDLRLPWHVR